MKQSSMDCVFIFSDQVNLEKLIEDFSMCAVLVGGELEVSNHPEYILTISKDFGRLDELEVMIFYTKDRKDYILPEYQERKMRCLTSNESGGDNKHLLLEFCHAYLKLNPDHVVCNAESEVYELKHLIIAHEHNLYYWIETNPDEILRLGDAKM